MRTSIIGLVVVVLAACASTPAPPAPPVRASNEPVLATPVNDSAVDAAVAVAAVDCSAAADALLRGHDVEPDLDDHDLDGDGVLDPVFRSCNGGRCQYFLYRAEAPCPRFLGEVAGSFVSPTCATPPAGGQPCRLSVMRFMIHGDLQEYLFDYRAGEGYVAAGYGARSVPGPSKPSKP